MANEQDFVDLGLHCADICKALERGINEKKLDDISKSLCEAINQLNTWVESAVHSLDGPLTTHLVAERLRRSKGGSPNKAGATQFPDLSIPEVIRKRLPLCGQNSTEFFRFSTYVQTLLPGYH